MGEIIANSSNGPVLMDFTKEIAKIKADVGRRLFELGALLKAVKEKELYKQDCDTFNEYLASPEVSLSRSTAFKAMKLAEVFWGWRKELEDIDTEKLYLVSGIVAKCESENEAWEWIEKARALSRSDLRDEVREKKGKLPRHSLSVKEKAKMFFDVNQPRDYVPDNEDEWEKCFIKLIVDFVKWESEV